MQSCMTGNMQSDFSWTAWLLTAYVQLASRGVHAWKPGPMLSRYRGFAFSEARPVRVSGSQMAEANAAGVWPTMRICHGVDHTPCRSGRCCTNCIRLSLAQGPHMLVLAFMPPTVAPWPFGGTDGRLLFWRLKHHGPLRLPRRSGQSGSLAQCRPARPPASQHALFSPCSPTPLGPSPLGEHRRRAARPS